MLPIGNMAEYCVKPPACKIKTQRAAMLHSTIDFGRRYKDIVDGRGHWVMEQWLHWTETWSVIILQPYNGKPILHQPEILKMWNALRATHCFRPLKEHAYEGHIDQIRHHQTFSRLAGQTFGPSACKWNLDQLQVRLCCATLQSD